MAKRKHKQCEICSRDTVIKCNECGKDICLGHAYQYKHEFKTEIKNEPLVCAECYVEIYGN